MIDLRTLRTPRPILIAEIGGNHHGELSQAYELSRLAAEHGADVVKFQTYSADGLVNPELDPDRHQHFQRFELPANEWQALAAHVRALGVEWMTSLWDPALFDVIEPLVPAFKVGSGDFTNWPFLLQCLETKKPLILSTAMCDLDEVKRTVDLLLERDPSIIQDGRLALLQCTAQYEDPETPHTNIAVMNTYRSLDPGVVVGFSNHFSGVEACRAALVLGAQILEVHFTSDRSQEFRDHRLSVLPDELETLRELCELIPALVGSEEKTVQAVECKEVGEFRRALFLRSDTDPGKVIRADDLIALRPEVGIPAWRYEEVVGRRLTKAMRALEPLSFDFLE